MAEFRVLVAPDSFGGYLSAPDACARMASPLSAAGFRVRSHPMSDGGEGLLDALGAHRSLELHGVPVPGPLGPTTFATAGRLDGAWVIESAAAVGLHLCGEDRKPGRASSEGLGWLLADLARRMEGPIIIGLGGSATVDAGLGLTQALGLTALDGNGRPIPAPWGATALTRVQRLVGPPPLTDRVVQVWADVRTELSEAAARFGPQKGVAATDIASLTEAHLRWADTLSQWRTDHGLPSVDAGMAGGGAAGGIGLTMRALVGAHIVEGAHRFARMTDLSGAMSRADAVVTGEGRMDQTSFAGKVAEVVTASARRAGIPVFALVGAAADVPPPPLGPDRVIETGVVPDRDTAMDKGLHALVAALRDHRP
jgi:glycerate kinase